MIRVPLNSLTLSLLLVSLGIAEPLAAQQNALETAAKGMFHKAQLLEADGQLVQALTEYEVVVDKFPNSSVAPLALLRSAWVLLHQRNVDKALDVAERLINEYAKTPHEAEGEFVKAEIKAWSARTRGDLENAQALFRRISLQFPRKVYPVLPARSRARVRTGEIGYHLGDFQRATAALVAAIEDEVHSEWTIRAQLVLAKVLLATGDWLSAADLLQRMESLRPGDTFDAEMIAQAHRLQTSIHRLVVRPRSDQASWLSTSKVSVPTSKQLRKPIAVAARADGHLAIVYEDSGALIWLQPDGEVSERTMLDEPGRPWWHQGILHVPAGDRVRMFPGRSSQTFDLPKRDKLERVKAQVAGVRNIFQQFFILQRSPAQVLAFEADSTYQHSIFGSAPVDLTTDARGQIFVLAAETGQIVRFSPAGVREEIVTRHPGPDPSALEVDALGRLYVLDRKQKQVWIYDAEGRSVTHFGPYLPGGTRLQDPMDLAIDGSGRLFIADRKLQAVVVLE